MSVDAFSKFRSDFPIFSRRTRTEPFIYFDSAATSQKPFKVIEAVREYYAKECGTVHRAVYSLAMHATAKYHSVREQVRAFLNASKSREIIFTRGTTAAINLVARSFGKAFVQPGDEILVFELEHHSNIVPWQMLCQERGAILKVIPSTDAGEVDMLSFATLLSARTRMVAIAHVSNVIGTIHPIDKIIRMAHAAGAKVLIDGAQAAGHLPVDVTALDADFYLFSGHKIYGPTGVGVLYGKEELLLQMPPEHGGGDMIETVSFAETTYQELPLKFEAGTPMIASVCGLGAALEYIEAIGRPALMQHAEALTQYALSQLQRVEGVKVIGAPQYRGPIISFVVEGLHHLDIGSLLDAKGICVRTGHQCAQPAMKRFGITGTVRVSFALYNTRAEVDLFIKALQAIIVSLRASVSAR